MIGQLFDTPISVSELLRWPLIHGSYHLHCCSESIRQCGLLSASLSKKSINTFEPDRLLGRHEYVFLSIPHTAGNYGGGNLVLVDPRVLGVAGTKCSLVDVAEVVQVVRRLAENSTELPGWVIDKDMLRQLVDSEKGRVLQDAEILKLPSETLRAIAMDCTAKNVIASPEFKKYIDRYYSSPEVFYGALLDRHRQVDKSTRAFLCKIPEVLGAEVLVPNRVEPCYLLGCITNGSWHCWQPQMDPAMSERTKALISLYSSAPK